MLSTQADEIANSLAARPRVEVVSVWRRLMAGVVDWLVVLAWGAGLGTLAAILFGLLNVSSFGLNFVLGSIFLGFPMACVVVIWKEVSIASRISSKGDTFGHRLFGMRIEAISGNRIGRRRAVVRQFLGSPLLSVYFLSLIPLILWIPFAILIDLVSGYQIGVIGDALVTSWMIWGLVVSSVLTIANHVWMGFDAEGRGWHDWIAGTVVVSASVARPPRASAAVSLRSSASPSRSEGEEYSP